VTKLKLFKIQTLDNKHKLMDNSSSLHYLGCFKNPWLIHVQIVQNSPDRLRKKHWSAPSFDDDNLQQHMTLNNAQFSAMMAMTQSVTMTHDDDNVWQLLMRHEDL